MRLLRLLSEVSLLKLTLAILASVISGFAAMAALILVFESLRRETLLWWQFAAGAAFAMMCREWARILVGQLASKAVVRLRRLLVRSVLDLPLLDLETIGQARIMVAFTSDLATVGLAIRSIVSLCASAAFLVALVGYLAWLVPPRAAVVAVLLVVCLVGAVFLRRAERERRQTSRASWDRAVHVFSMMLDGLKQLKLNRQLARQIMRAFKDRRSAEEQARGKRNKQGDVVGTWVQFMFYVTLGAAVFLPFGGDLQFLRRGYGYGLLALLHIRGPLRSVITDGRGLAEASISLERITELGLTVSGDQESDRGRSGAFLPRKWRRLEWDNVGFDYMSEGGRDDFVLGPLTLSLQPGEIVFIAGGNGSGKTTFAKLLTGLYPPTRGTIKLDGKVVDESNVGWYRSNYSAVFADFCLFEGVADVAYQDMIGEMEQLATQLKLDRSILEAPDASQSTSALSSGERRRLALLMALLEDRPILVFDEWAADQDPVYKELFYTKVLPRIRDAGKLVVVISHDERYFHLADRILWLERGEKAIWRSPSSYAATAPLETANLA